MRHFEPEPRATPPKDFAPWFDELMLLADTEGLNAVIGTVLRYAPVECVRALTAQPARWAELVTRARYADELRWFQGVRAGRVLHSKQT